MAAFGAPALKELYVSTNPTRLSGSLFKLEAVVPGLLENRFRP